MVKRFVQGLGFIFLILLLAACQNDNETESHESHSHETESDDVVPATLEGFSDHYHTGDSVELTVQTDLDSDGHWHWYMSENDTEWEIIEGELENTLMIEAIDGQKIKAALYDGDHNVVAESEPVEISIDDHNSDIYNGHFDDNQVEDRNISDWAGEWQSVYPHLKNGDLNEVFEHKAEEGDMTKEEYKDYYEEGYITEVNNIDISNDGTFTFYESNDEYTGVYTYDSYEVLEYEAGNRGVRFIFEKSEGDEEAPQFIQFSDHIIAPEKSSHFHLYWGDDKKELLDEVVHWPTYYPADLTVEDIKKDMLNH